MRARWEGIRADLLRSVSSLQSERQFNEIKGALFERFASPSALVTYLNDPGGDRDEKDRIYGVLVRAVQVNADWAELASATVWLGLWPRLDLGYRKRLRHFRAEPDELVQAISIAFTTQITTMDLSRVNRIASTLVRSTDREVLNGLRKGWERDRHFRPTHDGAFPEPPATPPRGSSLFVGSGLSPDDELAALRRRLRAVVGADVDLLVAVLVLGLNQREAGEQVGLPHDTARKRFQRALVRARKHFQDGLSQPAPKTGVS